MRVVLISGAVTLVSKNGKVVSLEAMGVSDLDSGKPMQKDDIFWIASMTKPLVGVAIMMLKEEGKLNIHDTLESHLTEFEDLWMVEGKRLKVCLLARLSLFGGDFGFFR